MQIEVKTITVERCSRVGDWHLFELKLPLRRKILAAELIHPSSVSIERRATPDLRLTVQQFGIVCVHSQFIATDARDAKLPAIEPGPMCPSPNSSELQWSFWQGRGWSDGQTVVYETTGMTIDWHPQH